MTLLICVVIWYLMVNDYFTLAEARLAYKGGEAIAQLIPVELLIWICAFFYFA